MFWILLQLLAAAPVYTNLGAGADYSNQASTAAGLYVEDLPGVRTGVVNPAQRRTNSLVINRYLGRGGMLRMRAGTRLEIAGSLTIGSGGGIVGDGVGQKPTIFMPASAFDNRNDVADQGRYGPRSVGINFSGRLSGDFRPSYGVRLENFRLISEQRTGRRLRGIVGRNVSNCLVRNVEIAGLPMGIGLALASAKGCRISNIHVHDFWDDTAWTLLPQSTGIEIDNDIVGQVSSSGVLIEHFLIERLRVGGPLLSKWGYQTDGINVLHSGSRVAIENGRIADVGEGIDMFGSDGTIRNVRVERPYIFGLKFIHGASRNRVWNVAILSPGLAGVNFSGSNQAHQNTSANVITGLKVVNVGAGGAWKENSTAGVLVSGANARRVPVGNRVINAQIDLGPGGKYGWLDQSTGRGNSGTDVEIRGGRALERAVLIFHGASSVQLRRGADDGP